MAVGSVGAGSLLPSGEPAPGGHGVPALGTFVLDGHRRFLLLATKDSTRNSTHTPPLSYCFCAFSALGTDLPVSMQKPSSSLKTHLSSTRTLLAFPVEMITPSLE